MVGVPSSLKGLTLRKKSEPEDDEDFLDEDEDLDGVENSPKDTEDGAGDVLAQLRIEVETEFPEAVLTSGAADAVRFRDSTPKGYYPADVNAYQEKVTSSIRWYAQALHTRDRDVHRLATEIDRTRTDMLNQKFQMEILRGKSGKPLVNPDGSYVTESQIEERPEAALQVQSARVSELQAKMDTLQAETSEELSALRLYAEEMEQHVTILEGQILTLQNGGALEDQERSELHTRIALLQSQIDSSNQEGELSAEEITQLRTYVEELEQHVTVLEGQLLSAQNNLTPASSSKASAAKVSTNVDAASADSAALSDQERAGYEALQAWAQEVEVSYADLEARLAQAESDNEALRQANTRPDDTSNQGSQQDADERVQDLEEALAAQVTYSEQLQEYADQLLLHIDQISANDHGSDEVGVLPAAVSSPVSTHDGEESHDDDSDYDNNLFVDEQEEPSPSTLSVNVDGDDEDVEDAFHRDDDEDDDFSQPAVAEPALPTKNTRSLAYAPELPEGVELPSQKVGRKSEFAPAYPGAPMTTEIRPEDL